MRRLRSVLGTLSAGVLALGFCQSCATQTEGQIMLALQTDVSLPKDINVIRVEVSHSDTGSTIYAEEFVKLGDADSIKLPGTFAFLAYEGPLRFRVVGMRTDESVEILRDVVTTIPEQRIATLPITLEFLCSGKVQAEYDSTGKVKRDAAGNVIVESTCPEGLTCVAGSCVTQEVSAEELPEYKQEEIFGGGSSEGDGVCFDTAKCFEGGSPVALDMDLYLADLPSWDPTDPSSSPPRCQAVVDGEQNLALLTQGGGICGATSCYVALNADDSAGYRVTEENGSQRTLSLPPAVCEKVASGEVLGLVAAPPGGETCQLKKRSIPTCGPWSSTGTEVYEPPPGLEVSVVAPGQESPSSLAINDGILYWITRAVEVDPSSGEVTSVVGTVKAVSVAGGEPLTRPKENAVLGALTLDENRKFVFWTSSEESMDQGVGRIKWAPMVGYGLASQGLDAFVNEGGDLLSVNLPGEPVVRPEGIGVEQNAEGNTYHVWWTEALSQNVYRVGTIFDDQTQGPAAQGSKEPVSAPAVVPPPTSPGAVATNITSGAVCWLYTGKFPGSDGVVACRLSDQSVAVAELQHTPKEIAIYDLVNPQTQQKQTFVYWSNFDVEPDSMIDPLPIGGGIYRAEISGGATGPVEAVAAEDYPGGFVIDEADQTLYWTSRTNGTVKALGPADAEPRLLVEGQISPGSLVVDADALYWTNQGDPQSELPNGAIMKALKATSAK